MFVSLAHSLPESNLDSSFLLTLPPSVLKDRDVIFLLCFSPVPVPLGLVYILLPMPMLAPPPLELSFFFVKGHNVNDIFEIKRTNEDLVLQGSNYVCGEVS